MLLENYYRDLRDGLIPAGRFKNTVLEDPIARNWLKNKQVRFARAVEAFAKTQDPFPRRTASARRVAKLRAWLGQ